MPQKKIARKASARASKRQRPGTLFVIGGHEDRHGVRGILKEFARYVGRGKLVVATVASSEPGAMFHDYLKSFHEAGLRNIAELVIRERKDALTPETLSVLDDAKGVFFTGGDQLRVTSHIGGSPVYERICEIFRAGGIIGGTSAGASIVADNMLINGPGETSAIISESMPEVVAGLALLNHMIIDQHFTQRGRLGRLLGAICRNPTSLGLGLDENTGAIFTGHGGFHVVGAGAVYVIDARTMSFSNFADDATGKTMSVYDLKMHVLSQGDAFDLTTRVPHRMSKQRRERLPDKDPI